MLRTFYCRDYIYIFFLVGTEYWCTVKGIHSVPIIENYTTVLYGQNDIFLPPGYSTNKEKKCEF